MKAVPSLFRITSIVIFVQLLLGGLLTFNFITPTIHIIVGFIVFGLAIATMVVALRSKNVQERVLRTLSVGLVALIVVQIVLGFETLRTSNSVLAWIHFAVALGIYGMSAAGSVMSSFLGRMSESPLKSSTKEVQQQS
jgi:heme A synthase